MRKDYKWKIEVDDENVPTKFNSPYVENGFAVHINIDGISYFVSEDTACITHAILLLIDATKEKGC